MCFPGTGCFDSSWCDSEKDDCKVWLPLWSLLIWRWGGQSLRLAMQQAWLVLLTHRRHSASLQERKWLLITFICQQFAVTTHHSPWKCFWLATTWEDEVVLLIKPAAHLGQGEHPCVWFTLPLSGLSCPPLFSFLLLNPPSVNIPALSCLPCDVFPNKSSLCATTKCSCWTLPCYLSVLCVLERIQRDFGFSSSSFPFVLFIIVKQQLRHQPELFLCCTGNKPITLSLPYNWIIEAWCHLGFHAEQPPDSNFTRPQPDNQPECQLSKVPEIESDKAIISFSLSVLYHFLPLNCS